MSEHIVKLAAQNIKQIYVPGHIHNILFLLLHERKLEIHVNMKNFMLVHQLCYGNICVILNCMHVSNIRTRMHLLLYVGIFMQLGIHTHTYIYIYIYI